MPRKAHDSSGGRKRTRTNTTGIVEGWRRESAASGTFYNFTAGLHRVRILPGFSTASDEFWFTNVMHHGFTVDNRRIAPCCYDFHFGISCPVCTVVNWLREHKAELTTYGDLAQRFSARRKFIVNVNPHGMPEVKLASLGQKAMDQIFSFFTMPEYGDISDEESGTDLYVDRKGEGFDTTYNVTPVPNSTGPIAIKNWDQRLKDPAKEVRIVPYKDLVQLVIDHMPDTVPVKKIVAAAPRKQPTLLIQGGDSMPRGKQTDEVTIPLDPETEEPLTWFPGDDEEEACWYNERTNVAYMDIPHPPDGWEPPDESEEEEEEEGEFEAPLDPETDEPMAWNDTEGGWEDGEGQIWTEEDDGEDYAAPPEDWEPEEEDEEEEEEEEPEPEPVRKKKSSKKKTGKKAKVTKKKASKKTGKKAGKKKSSKKAGKKGKKAGKKKGGKRGR